MLQKTLLKDTRETWLLKMTLRFIKPYFKSHGLTIPKVRLSVGVPYARNPYKVVGQCFGEGNSKDRVCQIFISPTQDNAHSVVETLMHELIHATIGIKEGHGKVFKDAALKLGFEMPMRSTPAGGLLKCVIKGWIRKAGKFPHSALSFSGRKKQSTRMIKMSCERDQYIVRAAKTPVEAMGAVICPVCKKTMKVETPEDDES